MYAAKKEPVTDRLFDFLQSSQSELFGESDAELARVIAQYVQDVVTHVQRSIGVSLVTDIPAINCA